MYKYRYKCNLYCYEEGAGECTFLDKCRYRFTTCKYRHYELEVEPPRGGTSNVINTPPSSSSSAAAAALSSSLTRWGCTSYKLNSVETLSVKAPGFNP